MDHKQILAIHRRNRIDQLAGLPTGCWVEIDIEIRDGFAYLSHDPLSSSDNLPDKLDDFIPAALKNGVAGFIVDCKRENAEKIVDPLLSKLEVKNYFYLNEMEVQADILQSLDAPHQSGIRIWKYRSADDIIIMAEDMKRNGQSAPQWIWVDCWQRGLFQDIKRAFIPMSGDQAQELQELGVRLCICSPELYAHKYDVKYTPEEMGAFYNGVVQFRRKLENLEVSGNMICTKFPWLWTANLNLLIDAQNKLGSLDFGPYARITDAEISKLS
ncbi:MAG: hypothetical protein PHX43_08015 [Alphaproteobacteria bacterium]|nr:hypothetical protein [Alphaproteobacteria bacterium]